MTSTTIDAGRAEHRAHVVARVRSQRWLPIGVLAATLAYLAHTWVAFDVNGLLAKAEPERAVILATDSIAHKVHVVQDLRRGGTTISIEGERTSVYSEPPPWVTLGEDRTDVDLGDGFTVTMEGSAVTFVVPGYGTINVAASQDRVTTTLPDGPVPDWLRATDVKFDARPVLFKRLQVSRSKIEVHRYFYGWENFLFPSRSELSGYSLGDLVDLAFSADRLNPELSNAAYMFETFWTNPDWQHGHVFIAVLETILMAVLGTFTAAFVGLPLAFLAASNFTPSGVIRFVVRRLFDFVRGIDMLIWSLIFIRAFGLGPLTGALAIAFTDTGTLGKLFSEALENIDNKQVDGVRSTGASRLQRYRYGVIPQILPVFVSQGLYYLESNTRSATVIGALGAGGIGLMLVETMRTARDWENTLYIIILVILVVFAMDSLSSWLRRKLIAG